MKKTILHLTDQLGVGGTEVLLKNTVQLLQDYNHVICYLKGSDELKPAFKGHPVYCLEHWSKKNILRSVTRLRKIIKKHNIDIVHAHLFWPTIIARLAKTNNVKLVSTIHSILSKDAFEKNKLSLWMEKATVNRQDALVAVSKYALKDYLHNIAFKGSKYVLYNFIGDDFFETKINTDLHWHSGALKCIAVGNLKDVKNYPFILETFPLLKEIPVSLHIYGDGRIKPLLQQIIHHHELSSIQLKGVAHNLQNVLPAYQVFVQMSLYEGFGIALLEAMACGLVPVLSDIPVHREVAGECAFYVSLDSREELANTLKFISENKDEWIRRQQLCMSRANEIASKEVYLMKLRSIYNKLMQAV